MRLRVALSAYTCIYTVYTCTVGQEHICDIETTFAHYSAIVAYALSLHFAAKRRRLVSFISRAIKDSYDMHRREDVFSSKSVF